VTPRKRARVKVEDLKKHTFLGSGHWSAKASKISKIDVETEKGDNLGGPKLLIASDTTICPARITGVPKKVPLIAQMEETCRERKRKYTEMQSKLQKNVRKPKSNG